MRSIIIFLVVLALFQGAYAQCDCPKPSEWSDCSGGSQERFVYNCNETTGGNCFGSEESRVCSQNFTFEMWAVFIAIILAIAAVLFLLLSARKNL